MPIVFRWSPKLLQALALISKLSKVIRTRSALSSVFFLASVQFPLSVPSFYSPIAYLFAHLFLPLCLPGMLSLHLHKLFLSFHLTLWPIAFKLPTVLPSLFYYLCYLRRFTWCDIWFAQNLIEKRNENARKMSHLRRISKCLDASDLRAKA